MAEPPVEGRDVETLVLTPKEFAMFRAMLEAEATNPLDEWRRQVVRPAPLLAASGKERQRRQLLVKVKKDEAEGEW